MHDSDSQESKINKTDLSSIDMLQQIRIKNVNKLIIGNLNINSIRNKFDQLKVFINRNIDIFVNKKQIRSTQSLY